MKSAPLPADAYRRMRRLLLCVVTALAASGAAWLIGRLPQLAVGPLQEDAPAATGNSRHPPWIYGRTDARFTIIEYADLQCEYCRAYFPVLRAWIDQHLEVNWQWHHLPLSMHEPAATQAARLAECAGESAGNVAFWRTVAKIYASSSDAADDLNALVDVPPAAQQSLRSCVQSQRLDAVIRAQADAASREGIAATPTLRLVDNHTSTSLVLFGPAEGDTLLSAIDWLIVSPSDAALMETGRNVTIPHVFAGDESEQ